MRSGSRALFYAYCLYAVLSLTSMAPMNIGAGLLLLAFILTTPSAAQLRNETRNLLGDLATRRLLLASLFLVAACLASWVHLAIDPVVHAGQSARLEPTDALKLWYLIWPFVLALGWGRLSPHERVQVFRCWLWVFFLISWIGVQQFFTGWPRHQGNPSLPGYNHPVLFLGHHLSVASVWIFPFFVALDWMISPENRQALRVPRGFWPALFAANAFVLFFLYSRTLWIALPLGLVLWGLLRLSKRWSIGLVLLLLAAGGTAYFQPAVQQRLHDSLGRTDRYQLWAADLALFRERPLFGTGFKKTSDTVTYYLQEKNPGQTQFFVGHAHNIYLEMLTSTGVVGLAAFLVWILFALLATRSGARVATLATPVAVRLAWLVFLINGLTQVNFWEGKVIHQLMWITGWTLTWRSKPTL